MKKGQTGEKAAALVGVMLVIFIFYIIFLPPEERTKLLGEEEIIPGEIQEIEGILLSEQIGRLSFVKEEEYDHYIPNIVIMETRNAQILAAESTFTIKKGWFSDKRKKAIFTLKEIEKIENPILSFQTPERKGTLRIVLNGVPLFEGEIQTQNPPAVKIPKEILANTNTLEFSVIGGFFSKKKYTISNLKVIGDIKDIEKQKSRNTFKITRKEYDNLENSYLYFYPECTSQPTLTITMNGKPIYSAIPMSSSLNRQELFKDELKEDKNVVLFEIDKGRCRIEQIKVRNTLRPVKDYLAYFNIKESLYEEVLDKDRHIILTLEFIDDNKIKEAELNVNGIKDVIDQKEAEFESEISNVIKKGNNYIEIKPLTELDIVKLEVRVE